MSLHSNITEIKHVFHMGMGLWFVHKVSYSRHVCTCSCNLYATVSCIIELQGVEIYTLPVLRWKPGFSVLILMNHIA